ncbi:hypothetical protein AVEN_110555-1 [Araneus ventricosus]|uniref:Uncharacterized protein n=1 Tax=Araneus ventricosus TaxID=182803 RepID=A0A4Y2LVT5_ARAVE|nr:hypothetical protein AVEN_112972-1 [Araneus ventricosus]GBN18240.1 hypothetical protein AVEN_15882-1 [Araneus ventricosus]GBN74499.1 hypothetical protein AVEN_134621-1 [Araneus ventricosus]GBN74506.1 hypothetical protein AVEN_110555-1 [Araneus ventricosus]
MLRVVTVEQSRIILYKGFKVKPGQKLCASCRNKLLKIKQIDESNVQNSLNTEDEDHDVEFTPAELLQKRNVIAELNSSFHEIGCSPMKLHALGEHSRSFYGKEKLQRVHETVKEKIQNVLEVDLPEEKNDVEKSVIKKSEDLDKLVDIIKNELSDTSRRKQIKMLTIPSSLMWSRRKIKEAFNVSDYSVRKAQKLFKDQGFLAEPARRNGKQLSPDIIELVKKFYQLDEQSRILPGMKDVVSIGKKVYERKRLILCNLSELYSSFKLEYPNLKIGFSKFCSLRPKWCVLAGASGTHLVCVCTIHQNVILLIHGAGFEEEYKQLMSYIVCEGAGRECMLRHCDKCPSKDNLVQFLQAKFEDYDDEDIVEYNQWVSTDRTEMIRCSTSVGELIEKLVEKLNKLIPHSYIAKSQSSFFKNLKGTASSNTAVVSMDFSENYAFTIRDEAQGYHWNSNSCTIHPVMIHCKDTSNVKLIIPLCIISDDLKRDHISKEAVDSTSLTLESRLKDTQTLPGTRLLHNFQPIDDLGMIEARRISRDETPALTFNLLKHQTLLVKMKDLYPGCFVGCIYDNSWYFGMVSEVNAEEDVTVKFLHPNGPSLSFFWQNREDVCAVPIPHIITIVKPPKTMTGRTYQFSQECMLLVKSSFENI